MKHNRWKIVLLVAVVLALLATMIACGGVTYDPNDDVTHTVTFQDVDGTVLSTVTVKHGEAAVAPEINARPGYEFTGWDKTFDAITSDLTVTAEYVRLWTVTFVDYNGDAIGTVTVRDGATVTPPAVTSERDHYTFTGWDQTLEGITADTTITATYEEDTKYTVTFLDHDGTVLATETVYEGEAATAPAVTSDRAHYTFDGWDVTFDSITADTTVTATYVEDDKFTVTFLDHDGETLKTETVYVGEDATAPAAPSRLHYTFAGWDTVFTGVTANLTVTATYTENAKFTVTFVDYDGEVLKTETVYTGEAATAPAVTSDRAHYTFDGWDVTFDSITADTTVTATYVEDDKFTVTFQDHDGETLKTEIVYIGEAATAPSVTSDRAHFTFSGWDKTFTDVQSDLTVTAQYTEDEKFTVNFVDHDGTVLKTETVYRGEDATAPAEPTRDNHTFEGWDAVFTNVTSDLTVSPIWREDGKFLIKFVDHDGTLLHSESVYAGGNATAPSVTSDRAHFTFSGWDKTFTNVQSDLTVTAQYTEDEKFTVTFLDHDGEVLKTEVVYIGEAATAPQDPTREHYTFAGWDKAFNSITATTTVNATYTEDPKFTVTFVDYDGDILKTETVYVGEAATAPSVTSDRAHFTHSGWDKTFDNITAATTVTAQYTEDAKFTVTFRDYNGTVLKTETVYIGEAATAPAEPTRENYTFAAWDTAFDNVRSALTVTATYTENPKFTVTFVDHDGTTLKTETVYVGKDATAPASPTREHYTFAGWDKTFTNVQSALTVTATYTEDPKFVVSFVDHDNTPIGSVSVYRGDTVAKPEAKPTLEGYSFSMWQLNGVAYDFSTPVTAAITLKATYIKASYTAVWTDETGNVLKTQPVLPDAPAVAPVAPFKAHHVFDKWVTENDTSTDEIITYTPTYQPLKHVVTFIDANGTGHTTPVTVNDCETVTAQGGPVYSGFTFVYWMTESGQKFDFTTKITKDTVLTAKYEINTAIPEPTVADTEVYISPGYLEFYMGLELQLNIEAISSYTTLNGKTTSGSYDVNYDGFDYTFYTDRPDVISITKDGTITPVSLGIARVWARIDQGGTQSHATDPIEHSNVYDDFTIETGTVLPAIEVKIIEKPAYLQLAEENPDTQQIQLGNDGSISINDFLAKPTGEYGSANIALWYNDATAVMTLTVDDNIVGDFNQWNAWTEEYGVPFSIFVISRDYNYYVNRWDDMTALGNEIQPHGHIHASAQYYKSGYFTSAQAWYDSYTSKQVIEAATGNQALVLSYPCGYNADFNSILYIGGRAVGTLPVNAATTNYNSVNIPGIPSAAHFESLFDPTVGVKNYPYGGWLNSLQHNIGGAKATYEEFLPLAKERMDSGELWAALFSAACQYGQERDTARIINMNAGADTITFTLTDSMNDLLFDHALTVKIKVDGTWTGARAYQNGGECKTRIVTEGGETYVYVNAVPDKGEVKVIRSATTNVTEEATRITFTPTGIAGNAGENTYTYTFTVNGTVWTNAYAVQNGAFIPATLETVGGSTTLSVTATVGGGEVTVVPVTDQYDARESLTMYEVAMGFVTPDGTKPVLISSAEDMVLLSQYVRQHGVTAGVTFRLTQDIDMSGAVGFRPIGWQTDPKSNGDQSAESAFSGTFDGMNYTLYNLSIYEPGLTYIGVFGFTRNATITRLNVIGDVEGLGRVGGVIGRMTGGTMSGVTFTGSVTSYGDAHFDQTATYIGGLVGQLDSVTMTNCAAYASVTCYEAGKNGIYLSKPNGDINSGNRVGGIVGEVFFKASAPKTSLSTFNNIIFEGTVTAHATADGTGGSYVGGFIGEAINIDAFNVTIKADVVGNTCVGGFGGYLHHYTSMPSNFKNCSASGTVTGNDYVGGFVGRIPTFKAQAYYNCIATVTVNAPEHAENVGALFGACPYASNSTIVRGVYYVEALNPGMAPHPGEVKDVTVNCIAVENAEAALTALNTYASANQFNTWRLMADGVASASYFPIYTVTILDKDGNIVDVQAVGNGLSAVMPEAPFITGFEFVEWSRSHENITANTTIQAIYRTVETHTVTFLDKDGATIGTVEVNDGRGAVAPEATVYDRFSFTGWDKDFSNVTADMTVTALYTDAYYVTFVYKAADGSETTVNVKVAKGAAAVAPELPTVEGSLFQNWDKDFSNVTSDMTVTAVYMNVTSGDLSLNVLQWHMTSAPTPELLNSLTDVDIVLYSGPKDASGIFTDDCGWAIVQSGKVNTGCYEAVIYRTTKYRYDDAAGTATNSVSNQTNAYFFAVPLIDNASNQQVVMSIFYMGSNAKPNEPSRIVTLYKTLMPALVEQYSASVGFVVAMNAFCDRYVNTGWTNSYEAMDASAKFVAGYEYSAHYEATVYDKGDDNAANDYATYIATFTASDMEATLDSTATHTDASFSTYSGVKYTMTIGEASGN